jgi:hypothetical protein
LDRRRGGAWRWWKDLAVVGNNGATGDFVGKVDVVVFVFLVLGYQ